MILHKWNKNVRYSNFFSEKITDIIFINCVYVNSTMLLDVAHPMHQFYKIKEKCNDQVFKVPILDEVKNWRKINDMFTLLLCVLFAIQNIHRTRKKESKYYCDREQTRDCIGGGGIPRLTTLCENRGSSSLLLQWFHLLLVCRLFLCKPRKPTCVTLKLSFNVYIRRFTWFFLRYTT